jgi:hypothetical protein
MNKISIRMALAGDAEVIHDLLPHAIEWQGITQKDVVAAEDQSAALSVIKWPEHAFGVVACIKKGKKFQPIGVMWAHRMREVQPLLVRFAIETDYYSHDVIEQLLKALIEKIVDRNEPSAVIIADENSDAAQVAQLQGFGYEGVMGHPPVGSQEKAEAAVYVYKNPSIEHAK